MDVMIYFVRNTLLMMLYVLDFAMLLRAVFSWIDPEQSSRFSAFLYLVTEPIIMPFRKLCYKMNWFQGTPLDVPFLITILVIALVQTLLRLL